MRMENKLMMKLVIGTEAMFFLSLMMAFIYFSLSPSFSHLEKSLLDIRSTGLFSLFLFASSFTYWRAQRNYDRKNIRHFKMWLIATLLLGLIFLSGQAKEYAALLHQQVNIASDTFGTSFFTLTGFHALHVIVGLIVIGIVISLAFQGDFEDGNRGSSLIPSVGLYWHFVDIVWACVFLLVYVKPYII